MIPLHFTPIYLCEGSELVTGFVCEEDEERERLLEAAGFFDEQEEIDYETSAADRERVI